MLFEGAGFLAETRPLSIAVAACARAAFFFNALRRSSDGGSALSRAVSTVLRFASFIEVFQKCCGGGGF